MSDAVIVSFFHVQKTQSKLRVHGTCWGEETKGEKKIQKKIHNEHVVTQKRAHDRNKPK